MRARNLLKGYDNSVRERLIDEKVHSDVGRKALKLKYIDGKTLLEISEILDIPYSTLTDKYYNRWCKELFENFGDE